MTPLKAIRLCRYSYERDLNPFYGAGYDTNYELVKNNDYCVVSEDAKSIVITFRGTDDFGDMLDNFKIRWDQILKGKLPKISIKHIIYGDVHKGFLDAWNTILPDVIKFTKQGILEGKEIITCGHSKGGALALLCAIYISATTGKNVQAFTFGCPKVGKKSFARRFGKKSKITHNRFVNGKDPVPRLPRSYMGFIHDSKPIHMEDGWFAWLWLGDLEDHAVRAYEDNIKRDFKI